MENSLRHDGRRADALRPLCFRPGFLDKPAGSVLVSCGLTRVLCCASIEDRVPPFRRDSGGGWLTAEYAMLPASTGERSPREVGRGRPGGRTMEIQRLIGRSLRAVVDLDLLGERTITLDCDVLQADGGTRTAAISGAFAALGLALLELAPEMGEDWRPLQGRLAAVSVGRVGGEALLDLDYPEDSRAEVDMNVVMTAAGRLIEVQGTAEQGTFSRSELDELLDLAEMGIRTIIATVEEQVFKGRLERLLA
jgi:ribonuclease PH